jgi:parvulin-like peptidyl-prolyl isomerase
MSLNTMRQKFGHNAKWLLGVVTVAMLVTTFAWNWTGRAGAGASSGGGKSGDDVVATADGVDITRQQYEQAIKNMNDRMGGGSTMMTGFIRSQALQTVLEGAELLAAAKKMGIKATDDDIAAMRERMLKANNVRKALGLPDNATVSEIDSKLQTTNPNASVERLFPDAEVERAAIMDKLEKRLTAGILVTDQDARDSYKSVKTQHILIDNKKISDEQARKKAEDILAKAKAPGADFAALAKQYSDDPGTKDKGGDDGWVDDKKGYVSEFMKAARALKPGEISDLVPSPQFGYFIIKLNDAKENLPKDFDKTKAQTIQQIQGQRKMETESAFMKQVRDAPHNVKILDPGMRADYTVEEARKLPASDPQQKAKYLSAIKDYQDAIAADNGGSATVAYDLQLAGIYEALNDKTGALNANKAAATLTNDPDLWMQVGNAYKDQKDTTNALAAYKNAFDNAYGNPSVYTELKAVYKQLGQTDLAAQADAKAKQLQAAQASSQPPLGGSPISVTPGGGQPISVTPGGGQPGTVTPGGGPPSSGTPGGGQPVTVTPGGAPSGQPISITPGGAGAKPIVISTTPAKGGSPKPGQ